MGDRLQPLGRPLVASSVIPSDDEGRAPVRPVQRTGLVYTNLRQSSLDAHGPNVLKGGSTPSRWERRAGSNDVRYG